MIRLISTDFDGTLFDEGADPPVPRSLQARIGALQEKGATWVINTGRDFGSLMETLDQARLSVRPDYLVLVEREIHRRKGAEYQPDTAWNTRCTRAHSELFRRVEPDLPRLRSWVADRCRAMIYADDYSPFCLVTNHGEDVEHVHQYLTAYCETVPDLSMVRNNVCTRFCHAEFNKGTALAEIARQTGATPANTFAAGDALNDVPMLSLAHARCLAAPANALPEIKELVLGQNGFVSALSHGHGVEEGLTRFMRVPGPTPAESF